MEILVIECVKLVFGLIGLILLTVVLLPLLKALKNSLHEEVLQDHHEMPVIHEETELEIPIKDTKQKIEEGLRHARTVPWKTARIIQSWIRES
ncbi:MAG: hypothetical protein HQM11_12300 [SAR324 cluster bacterium]|nr:hypothetical protein [SAR324 cluster bacterium]